MADARKEWLARTVGAFFSQKPEQADATLESLQKQDALSSFLDDPNVSTLQTSLVKGVLHASTKLSAPDAGADGKALVFFKLRPESLSLETLTTNVAVTSVAHSATAALSDQISNLFGPLLLHGDGQRNLDPGLQNLLEELSAGLKGSLLHATNSAGKPDESDFRAVLTPADEFKYWTDVAADTSSPDSADRAAEICSFFQPLSAYGDLASKPPGEVLDLVDLTEDAVDAIWKMARKPVFGEERMAHLLTVLGNALCRYIQLMLGDMPIWKRPYAEIREPLRKCFQIIDKYQTLTSNLTSSFWVTYDPHPWRGKKFSNAYHSQLRDRTFEIMSIRATHEQIVRLLSVDERNELRLDKVFNAFDNVQPFQISSYTRPLWLAAVKEYDRNLKAVEKRVSTKLRQQFANLGSQPFQLLKEYQRNKDLIARPSIGKELSQERETMLGELVSYVQRLRDELDQRMQADQEAAAAAATAAPTSGRNLPEVVNQTVWVRQLINKVDQIVGTASTLLGDLAKAQEFISKTKDLLQELKSYQKQRYADWVRDMKDMLSDPNQPLVLEMTGRLMELDGNDGKLKVTYSERLVALLREVRQLSALGFTIPREVQSAADNALKFYRHGVVLKQVANFYNTINTQMIFSQKGMLLESALAFEKVVKNPVNRADGGSKGDVTWNNPTQVEMYIDRLQRAANKITTENRKLRKYHMTLADKTIQLMNTDLLRNQEKWRSIIRDMRSIVTGLEQQGYKNLQSWKVHWDQQLYKALEFQYKLGLESLNDNLSDISAELIYKNGKLQFRPPLESIRAKYFGIMKKFINFPTNFTGVGDSDIFKAMAHRNASSLIVVYRKAEMLFQQLLREKQQFKDWVILGNVDIESLIEESFSEAVDWEINFKMVKQKGREVEKLPAERKFNCVMLSFQPVKATIEDHIQRLADELVASLRKSIMTDQTALDKFTTAAIDKLSARPSSIDEIAEANTEFKRIMDEHPNMRVMYDKMDQKNRLLRAVAGGSLNLQELQNKWENMDNAAEFHEAMIKEQVEALKGEVDGRLLTFNQEVIKFRSRWGDTKPDKVAVHDRMAAQATVVSLREVRNEFDELKATSEKITADCVAFTMNAPSFSALEELDDDIRKYEEGWQIYDNYVTELDKIGNEPWAAFRTHLYTFEDFIASWLEKVKGRTSDAVSLYLRAELDRFQNVYPMLKYVRGETMTHEHWHSMFKILGLTGVTSADLKFQHFLSCAEVIVAKSKEIKDLHDRSQNEIAIREALQELKIWGADALFNLVEHTENGRTTSLIREWKELFTAVGDNQSLLNSIKDSPYFKPFADEAGQWEGKLGALDEYLHGLNSIQRRWVYLEPIFGRGALPQEQPRFKKVDEEYRQIMGGIERDPRILSIVEIAGLRETLNVITDQLERCQKALSEYLEEKRSRFPRFYFLGDDDLLEILGQAQNPAVIQSHLKKLFQGIHAVQFNADNSKILAMRSTQGETVPLQHPVEVTDKVEVWLGALSDEMRSTLKEMVIQCLKVNDIVAFPSQVLGVAEMIHFTANCERAVQQQKLPALKQQLRDALSKYTTFDAGDDVVTRLKLKSLVLDIIHNIDIIDQLTEAKCTDTSAWIWQKQLRFYVNEKQDCVMRMAEAEFSYSYEYQGNAPKLVYTPLTDKCYLTLTQGIQYGYGGNPYGPAGTGKTESVKALGNIMGRQVLVFNCGDGIDYKSMGRIFIGLVKCGAWGCFDEFNRLDEEVLSAVSQQIQVIQGALKEKEPTLELLGKTIDVDFGSGIFVTMNPASKGYGGRSKLPDNLKQLFRSVAMTIPDLDLIAEVELYSEGFQYAREIGKRLVSIFQLSQQLLTPQQHYDWGLRAMKTVLRLSGGLLQNVRKAHSGGVAGAARREISEVEEAELVLQALRSITLSKLTYADSVSFSKLINDVFPGVPSQDPDYPDLRKAIEETMAEMHLDPLPTQIAKILQFAEALNQRMGVVLVGPSGSGKSTVWKVLRPALARLGRQVKQYTLNPKAMNRSRLLGEMDMDTREFTDGVLTGNARQVVKEPLEVHSWIICDGDIDPEWVESLNSVLDDNRLLTMPTGERITFSNNCNWIFETHNLEYASPATVSRMGMIFMSDEDMEIRSLVGSWLRSQPENMQANLSSWIDAYFYRALERAEQEEQVVESTRAGIVNNGLSHLVGVRAKGEFVAGLARGLGGNMPVERRIQFAKDIYLAANETPIDRANPLMSYWNSDTNRFQAYEYKARDLTERDLGDEDPPMIMTTEAQSYTDMFLPWVKQGKPFILVGPEGCGKSMMLRNCFARQRSTNVALVHCSAQTSAEHIVQKLNQTCGIFSSNTGRVYRPKEADRLILWLKDLNLPTPDKYATSELISFLQQLVTYGGFFDEGLEWIRLERVQIVGSMNPATTVGRHALTSRFTSVVHICYVSYPQREQLQTIYAAYLEAGLAKLSDKQWQTKDSLLQLAVTMVEIYDQVKAKFNPDDQAHYIFTPRDLTSWLLGALNYDLSNNDLLEVFVYECTRLFGDRLVGPQAFTRFDRVVKNVMQARWKVTPSVDGFYYSSWAGGTAGEGGAHAKFGKMKVDDFRKHVEGGIVRYEREFRDLHMTLFPEILDHVARVDRVLSQPGGSLLMVGRSGVGRRTATVLAAHMHDMSVFTPNISSGYTEKQMKIDIKAALENAGVAGKHTVLLIEDHHFGVLPSFIEYINSLLSSGEIPGFYTSEELDTALAPIKEQMSESGYFGGLFGFFVSRIKTNLHIVLEMDPRNPSFLVRCESNPALYTRCSMQWWDGWSEAGMRAVAHNKMAPLLQDLGDAAGVVDRLVKIHLSQIESGATPRHYTTLIDTYIKVFNSKRFQDGDGIKRLRGGLDKLNDASKQVDTMSKEAEDAKVMLAQKQEQADRALVDITSSMEQASEQKKEMAQLSKELEVEEKKLTERKASIELRLVSVQPVLEAARSAVGNIRQDHLNYIRSLKMPPAVIRDILEGVLRLMGVYDTSWNSMKAFIGNRSVVQEIVNFDVRKISPEIRASVKEMLDAKAASFEEKNAAHASQAAAPLAVWVKANIEYAEVLDNVNPLEKELAKASKQLERSEKKVSKLAKALKKVDDKVASLRKDFEGRTSEAAELKFMLSKTQATLAAAQTLLGKLDGEQRRWAEQVDEINKGLTSLPTHTVLASAFITYLPKTAEDERSSLMREWCEMCKVPVDWDFRKFMSNESSMLAMKAEGLPGDNLSMENALSILDAALVPFVIDPSQQATEWLKLHLKNQRLEVVNIQDPRFTNTLELAVRFGKTLVVQEVDDVPAILFPLLRKDLNRSGPRLTVEVGDKVIDYHEDFRLYLVTRNSAPELTPDASPLIAEVNFTVTKSGLEGQLLGLTIGHEKPELEEKKSQLLLVEEEQKVQLSNLESSLLKELADSTGNLLENKSLIDSLNETKSKSQTISASLAESKDLQRSLDAEREVYRPVSKQGAQLFFLLNDLSKGNHMYRFSLNAFVKLFQRALSAPDTSANVAARLDHLSVTQQRLTLAFGSRSLFKADRLMFGLHLVHLMHPELFGPNEWELFIGQLVADLDDAKASPIPKWASQDRTEAFALLADTLPKAMQLLSMSDANTWAPWAASSQPEVEFPKSVAQRVTAFQRLLLIQALRPDRLETAMNIFCCEVLGLRTLSPEALNLERFHKEDTSCAEPVLLIITPGVDPSQELEDAASNTIGRHNLHQVAMGQGQAEIALSKLRAAAEAGHWVLLKNMHLVISFLALLEKEMKALTPHKDFRLWLTAEPHDKFSVILLQSSQKITYEAPPGLKKNMLRTYEGWKPQYVAGGSTLRARALFTLAWFHAIVQERRTYVPQAWTQFYEFSQADLRASATIIDQICSENANVTEWEPVHGLLSYAIYGGRVSNVYDFRVLYTYLQIYFRNEVLGSNPTKRLTRGVALPNTVEYHQYLDIVNKLPETDNPGIFGLPANIDRSIQRANSARVIQQLKELGLPSEESSKFNRELWSQQLGPVIQLWQKLSTAKTFVTPGPIDIGIASKECETKSPVDSFVVMEHAKAHNLIAEINTSIGALTKVISGTALLSPAIMSFGLSLLRGKVPSTWEQHWEGPENPFAWLRQVALRVTSLNRWKEKVDGGDVLTTPLNLSDLFRPITFLNALRQQTARKSKSPIDKLKLVSSLDPALLKGCPLPVVVTGLLMQGAGYEAGHLMDTHADAPSLVPLPNLSFAWIPKDQPPPTPKDNSVSVPVYGNPNRDSFVLEVDLPCTAGDRAKWILASVALFLQSE